MKFVLDPNSVAYSKTEQKLFAMISGGKRRSTSDLIIKFYARRADKPYHARNVIGTAMRTLTDKAKVNKEPFIVKRSKRQGPKDIEYWTEWKSGGR